MKKTNKFPHLIDLERIGPNHGKIINTKSGQTISGFWWSGESKHKEVVEWLNEFIGKRGIDWWCQRCGYYRLKRKVDATAFKLRWL